MNKISISLNLNDEEMDTLNRMLEQDKKADPEACATWNIQTEIELIIHAYIQQQKEEK